MAKRKTPKSGSLFDKMDDGGEVLTRPPSGDEQVELHTAAEERYLNYALSVIT